MDEAERHRARLAPYVEPHLARRQVGVKHPIHDFLFQYYSFRPGHLLRWQPPGPMTETLRTTASATLRLLLATAAREGNYGCFGMHEWAMVYGPAATRHPQPLRLGREGTDEVVDGHRIQCSHWDAYRFFTPEARPLNTLRPFSGVQQSGVRRSR